MADAGVRSIDDLKNYGRALSNCGEALNDTFTDILNETNRVCEGWNDNNAQQFVERMTNKATELQKLSEIMIEFSAYIQKQCDILDEYERNKIR